MVREGVALQVVILEVPSYLSDSLTCLFTSRLFHPLHLSTSSVLTERRIGNLLVPNDNYCKFEDWLMPILDQMLLEQKTEVGLSKSSTLRRQSTLSYL